MPDNSQTRRVGFVTAEPVLPVDDTDATIKYYAETLGFTVEYTYGIPPYYAIVRRGDVRIRFSERENTTDKIIPCSVYVIVSDVEALYKEYTDKGIETFLPPEEQDSGMLEFEVSDLNGHFLVFGQQID